MNKIEAVRKEKLLECINYIRNFIERMPDAKTCATCVNWDDNKNLCKSANQTPPEHVQQNGCPHWTVWDEIPF